MRSLVLTLAGALLVLGAPTASQACLGTPNCPDPMDVTSIVCKGARSDETPGISTCIGHSGSTTPKTVIDVDGFIDVTFDHEWRYRQGIDITLWSGNVGRVLAIDTRRGGEREIHLRNVDTRLFPLMADRCVSAMDPASLVFDVYARVEARIDIYYQPTAWGWKLRISPDDFVNPPRC